MIPPPGGNWHGLREVFPVKLTGQTDDGGTWYYDGLEQALDPATGDLVDAEPALEFDDTSCYLFEVNNSDTDVSGSPVVWARFRGVFGGVPAFEFLAPSPPATAQFVKGKLDGALSAGGSATLSIWAWNGAAEADTGDNVTVYDWFLASGNIAATTKVGANFDPQSGKYYVTVVAC